MKKFGGIFLGALVGGGIYELYIYLFDHSSPDWKNAVIQVLGIALTVSIVLLLIRDYLNRKSEAKKDKKSL